MRVQRAWIALAIAAAVCTAPRVATRASAQTLTSGEVDGVARDSAGAALPGTSVTLVDRSTGASRIVVTGQDGAYRFMMVAPGQYDVLVERIGYRPVRLEGVVVNGGERLSLSSVLPLAPPPVRSVEVVKVGGAGRDRPGIAQAIPGSWLSGLPGYGRDLRQVARLSSMLGPGLAAQGLPPTALGFALDGMPFDVARDPALPGVGTAPVLPLSSIAFADYVAAPADAEWAGSAGGLLNAETPRGTGSPRVSVFGRYAVPGLASSPYFDASGLTYNDADGGAVISGPIVRDSAFLLVGVEARHSERPLAALWADGTGTQLLQVARDSFGVDLGAYSRPRIARTEAVSAFSRLDWQAAPGNAVDARAVFTRIPFADGGDATLAPLGAVPTYSGTDFVSSAGLRSTISATTANELRLGFDASSRDFGAAGGVDAEPLAILASPSLGFGAAPGSQGQFRTTAFRLRETLLYTSGDHRLRVGLEGSSTDYRQDYRYDAAGYFVFGSVADFASHQGLFVQRTGPAPSAHFTLGRYAVFAEDSWSPTPGLDLLFGVRAESQQLPSGLVAPDTGWLRLTGIHNDAIPKQRVHLAPRFALTWDPDGRQSWVFRAAAALSDDPIGADVLGELATQDGSTHVRRGLGTLAPWPGLPAAAQAPDVGPVLSMLGPDFRGPRTTRVSGGLQHRLAAGLDLDISATYRYTSFLPTRTDLNLTPYAAGQDQYGRPIYGTLEKVGGLLAAAPGSDRRFAGYDAVWALDSNAHSSYWGVTVGLRGHVAPALDLLGSYTHSSARDDWPSAWASGATAIAAAPAGSSAAAPDAPADYDVPDRVVLGAELRGPLGLRLDALYRYRSGLPFTPGFAAGVDANGDGLAGNDPAFVDGTIPGMSTLLSRWGCLSSQVGHFAARNSCRAPGVHSLDARASLGLFRFGPGRVELTVDAFNLVESDTGVIDAALYRLDPAGTLAGNHIPLVLNPGFGTILARQATGRLFRVGLSLNW